MKKEGESDDLLTMIMIAASLSPKPAQPSRLNQLSSQGSLRLKRARGPGPVRPSACAAWQPPPSQAGSRRLRPLQRNWNAPLPRAGGSGHGPGPESSQTVTWTGFQVSSRRSRTVTMPTVTASRQHDPAARPCCPAP